MSSNVGKSVILEEEMEDNYQPTEQGKTRSNILKSSRYHLIHI